LVRLSPKRDADCIYRLLRKIRKDQVIDYLSQIETFQESILDGSTQHPTFPFTKTSPIEFLTSTSQNPSHKNLSTSKKLSDHSSQNAIMTPRVKDGDRKNTQNKLEVIFPKGKTAATTYKDIMGQKDSLTANLVNLSDNRHPVDKLAYEITYAVDI
jgi:hypothetical protein